MGQGLTPWPIPLAGKASQSPNRTHRGGEWMHDVNGPLIVGAVLACATLVVLVLAALVRRR